ncbi:hypothetical protein BOTBODRAFT_188241 [Botryobasidium botryosum FD-172 SS1]|uniref:Polyketide synthase-like phosphopantetheine-binding domain-containing protein n=1 Tax=Botryobasidium botryosum (strain FD-172 SS1) TaxID=930990 RepID=A0A067MPF9_BOTB1|nr:hypothetical protein BOTBODRAFT_188241 [Botryobasidium botryosum FD-172 SS1]
MALLPPPPTQPGVGSKTFKAPPVDGSSSLPQIIDHHLAHSPLHPLFRYTSADARDAPYEQILWKDAARAVHRAARLITSRASATPNSGRNSLVIAFLANSDLPTSWACTWGAIRAGYQAFQISPRNSTDAIVHLLAQTGATHLVLGDEPALRDAANASIQALQSNQAGIIPSVFEMPTFGDLYVEDSGDFVPLPAMDTPELDKTAFILHTSGSTAFPKPIRLTHRMLLETARNFCYGELDPCGEVLGIHFLPFSHAAAPNATSSSLVDGHICAVSPPTGHRTVPTPEQILQEAINTECTIVSNVPSVLEVWAANPDTIKALQKFKAVVRHQHLSFCRVYTRTFKPGFYYFYFFFYFAQVFMGAGLHQEVGDALAASGVNLSVLYGATEFGMIAKAFRKPLPPDEWNYFLISGHQRPYLRPVPGEPGSYELFVRPTESMTPVILDAEVEGELMYATKDIIAEHPTKPGRYRYVRRADNLVVLSTGEKTNPVLVEAIVRQHPMVGAAVVFGSGRPQSGILIEPAEGNQIDPTDLEALASYRNAIWEVIEKANQSASTHARIFKEMIVVANSSKPFALTDKGSIKRGITLDLYNSEIEAAYAAVESSSQTDIESPSVWDAVATTEFVRRAVVSVLGHAVQDSDDIFQHGGDSLQATWIRNTILHALRKSDVPVNGVPHNFVYAAPSISELTQYVLALAQAQASADESEGVSSTREGARTQELDDMVAKYTTDFPRHNPAPNARAPESEVVLLTGSTGALGTAILAALVALSSVSRVYAFNRRAKDGASVEERQLKALREQGLDAGVIGSPKVVFVEGDVASPTLGLSEALFAEIRESVALIINNAWRVDFNVMLPSFAPLIQGVRNLADLALASPHPNPPRLVFTSSISVVRNWKSAEPVPEDSLKDPAVAIGSGYSESKWVSERILQIAADETALRPVIVRVGQLSGAANGSWNQREWLPSVVRSGQVLGVLPQAEGMVSWIPLSIAAAAIIELRNSAQTTHNLVHPRPVSWASLFDAFAASLGVQLVPFPKWFSRLEGSLKSEESEIELTKRNPALALLGYFGSLVSARGRPGEEVFGMPRLEMAKTVGEAESLREENLARLGGEDVERWLNYWRSTGFLQ